MKFNLAESASSPDCNQIYQNGDPDGSKLPLHLFDECYKGSAREILIPELNPNKPLSLQQIHKADDAFTNAYMQTKDAVPLVQASDGRHKPEFGSAFIIEKDGLAVTNHHVVANGRTQILLGDDSGLLHKATVVLDDPLQDLALLMIEKNNADEVFPTIELGSSQNLSSSNHLIAVGHTLGQPAKFMAVSQYVGPIRAADIPRMQDFPGTDHNRTMLETDATVFPGNSGGVLVDVDSRRAVGINDMSNTVNKAYVMPIERVIDLKNRWEALNRQAP